MQREPLAPSCLSTLLPLFVLTLGLVLRLAHQLCPEGPALHRTAPSLALVPVTGLGPGRPLTQAG